MVTYLVLVEDFNVIIWMGLTGHNHGFFAMFAIHWFHNILNYFFRITRYASLKIDKSA